MSEFLTLDHQTAAASTEYEDDNVIEQQTRDMISLDPDTNPIISILH